MSTKSLQRTNVDWLTCVAITLYALYLRVWTLKNREFWTDELYQFENCMGPLKPFWLHNNYGDHTAFPGEYLLSFPFIQIFGMNKWGLAIPHLLLTVLGFYFLFKLCRKYMSTWFGYAAAFLMVALNKNLIFHALEFRPYAVLPTLALGAFYFTELIIEEYKNLTQAQRIGIGLFFVLGINYHAFGLLIFTLPLLYQLIIRYGLRAGEVVNKECVKFFAVVFAVGALIWGWYASNNNFGMAAGGIQSIRETFQYIRNPAQNIVGFSKDIIGNLVGDRRLYVLLPVILLAVWPHASRLKQIIFAIICIALPIGLILFVDIRSQYWFVQRQFVWVMPLFAFWMAWQLDSGVRYILDKK